MKMLVLPSNLPSSSSFFSRPNPKPPSSPSLPHRPHQLPPLLFSRRRCPAHCPILASAAQPDRAPSAFTAEVDMFRGRDGVWSASQPTVVVLWDLDNKPPLGPPYEAAVSLRRAAETFGRVVDMAAYANRHAFVHLPQWILQQRRDQRRLDYLERRGLAPPPEESYVCSVCGRKCRTNLDLKKHFKQLHVREREKKLGRMRSLKGKKRQRFRERYITGNHKYEEAARSLLTPKTGYGLASELRRAGVFVKMVADKPQAADWALKRQMQHSMARGFDWLFLVSDDSDFSDMIRRARDADFRTVVVGDGRNALGRQADLWVSWARVQNREVVEDMFHSGLDEESATDYFNDKEDDDDDEFFANRCYEDGEMPDLDEVVDEIVVGNCQLDRLSISAFSEEELIDGANFAYGFRD